MSTATASSDLSALVDPASVTPIIEHRLGPRYFSDRRLRKAEPTTVKSRGRDSPTTTGSMTVTYRLRFEGSPGDVEEGNTYAHLRYYGDGTGPRRGRKREGHTVEVPELGAYGWMLPDDPKMPVLAKLLSSGTVVRYKPESRCIVTTSLARFGDAPVFAKVFAEAREAESAARVAHRVWEVSAASSFEVPRPLAFDLPDRVLWTAALPGSRPTVTDLTPRRIRSIASALAGLHRCRLDLGPPRSWSEVAREARRKAATLGREFPSIQQPLEKLEARWSVDAPSSGPPTTIHGAFRLAQLVVDNSRVGVVDFDGAATGDPLEDLSDLVYDLSWTPTAEALDRRQATATVDAYATATGRPVDDAVFHRFLSIQAAKRAFWCRERAHSNPTLLAAMDRHLANSLAHADGARR